MTNVGLSNDEDTGESLCRHRIIENEIRLDAYPFDMMDNMKMKTSKKKERQKVLPPSASFVGSQQGNSISKNPTVPSQSISSQPQSSQGSQKRRVSSLALAKQRRQKQLRLRGDSQPFT